MNIQAKARVRPYLRDGDVLMWELVWNGVSIVGWSPRAVYVMWLATK